MKLLVLLKFSHDGQVQAFVSDDLNISTPDLVLAETGQGLAMGQVVAVREIQDTDVPEDMLPIVRRATPEDLNSDMENRRVVEHARTFCIERIHASNLNMKLVNVESLFDLSKLLFYFTAPTRVDFRELVKELVHEFHTRIELRQIGVRHETQMLGAVGPCGMVCCCRRFLHNFVPVTIKMAKEQNLFLNPTKISGICGRLLCCLSYEQENYELFQHICPHSGKRYKTDKGPLKVLRANMFRNTVTVLDEQNNEQEMSLDEWTASHPSRPEAIPSDNPQQEKATNGMPPTLSDMMVVLADPDMDDAALDKTLDSAFNALEDRHDLAESSGLIQRTPSPKPKALPSITEQMELLKNQHKK